MKTDTATRPTLTVTLSTYEGRDRSEDAASYAEDGIDIADVDQLWRDDVATRIREAFPEYDVEIATDSLLNSFAVSTSGIDFGKIADVEDAVEYIIDTTVHGDQMDAETLRRRLAERNF